jgi:WD40 repeat protein
MEPELKWKWKGEEASTNASVFSKDGKYIYVQYSFKTVDTATYLIQKWNIETKIVEKEIPCEAVYNQMVLSNDENFLMGAENNIQYIQLINLKTSEIKTISNIDAGGNFSTIKSFAFSEDGNYIYAYHYSVKQIQIIDVLTLKRVVGIDLSLLTWNVEFSSDGKYAGIVNGDSTFSIWNLNNKTEIYKIKVPYNSFFICNIFVNSEYFIVNHLSNVSPEVIEVYSMKTGNMLTKTTSNYKQPYSILLNDNHTILTSTFPTEFVEKFDINTNVTTTINININGTQMFASSGGNYLVGKDSMNYLSIYDLTTEKPVMFLNKITENLLYCSKVLISKNNQSVYTAGDKNSDTVRKGQIIEYDFITGIKKNVYPISDSYIIDMILSKDSDIIYTVDSIGKIDIITNLNESEINQKIYELKKPIKTIAISEDNSKLIAGGFMTGFYYINLKTDSIKNDYKDPYSVLDFEPNIKTIALNKKGDKLVVAGNKKTIYVFKYNPDTDEYYKTNEFIGDKSLNSAYEGIIHVAFSDDEKYIYSSGCDGYTHIFDSGNYTEITKIKINPDSSHNFPTTAYLSKDNKTLFAGDILSGISIIDVMSGERLSLLQFQGIKFDRINSVALSNDNNYIAYCTTNGSVGLYKIDGNNSVIESQELKSIFTYPNPASDYIEITISIGARPNGNEASPIASEYIQIFNTLGEIILTVEQTSPTVQRIDISNLTSGIYFIRIGNKIEKFVKM